MKIARLQHTLQHFHRKNRLNRKFDNRNCRTARYARSAHPPLPLMYQAIFLLCAAVTYLLRNEIAI